MDDMLTSADVAALLGIKIRSVHRMRSRGDLPPADSPPGSRSPLWLRSTITQWAAKRPSASWVGRAETRITPAIRDALARWAADRTDVDRRAGVPVEADAIRTIVRERLAADGYLL